MSEFKPVIGLEVHVELKTKSKMFCGCSADYFGQEPNSHTCSVCLGLPGALPVPNKKAIEWCIMIALSLNCEINLFSKFDRKNYFYPDLPKGYQISQYDLPFGKEGWIDVSSPKRIRIRRVHMEEDTGKLIHQKVNGENVTLIDFNRSGVPLVEIVTEPDFSSTDEVKEYLQKLQQIIRYLDVSNANMERGEMRLEPNISLSGISNIQYPISNDKLPKYKVEVKNINSFKFVEKAIEYEIKRQKDVLDSKKLPVQETRGWDENKGITFSQRKKEEANDYRYFPEPDIPPIRISNEQIENIKSKMVELPDIKLKRFTTEYGLSRYDAEILIREREATAYFEEAAKIGGKHNVTPKQIANTLINKKPNIKNILPATLVKQITTSSIHAIIDDKELMETIENVVKEYQKAVEDYRKGKETSVMFLIGQVMRRIEKKVDAQKVKTLIEQKIKS